MSTRSGESRWPPRSSVLTGSGRSSREMPRSPLLCASRWMNQNSPPKYSTAGIRLASAILA